MTRRQQWPSHCISSLSMLSVWYASFLCFCVARLSCRVCCLHPHCVLVRLKVPGGVGVEFAPWIPPTRHTILFCLPCEPMATAVTAAETCLGILYPVMGLSPPPSGRLLDLILQSDCVVWRQLLVTWILSCCDDGYDDVLRRRGQVLLRGLWENCI